MALLAFTFPLVLLSSCSKSDASAKSSDKSASGQVSAESGSTKNNADDQSNGSEDNDQSGETNTAADGGPTGAKDGSTKRADGKLSGPRGDINKVEPTASDPGALTPVGITDVAKFDSGVTVRVASTEPTTATAKLPGEIAGPAVLVKLELSNGSSKVIDLDGVAVTMTNTSGSPVVAHLDPKVVPFSGSAAPRSTATGSYLFRIDPDQRENVTLSIKYSSDTPTAIITGSLPNG
ncbi:MAG: hypothetical protein KDB26_12160 [Microthrixaceae bacterium]|nr:hypothetical protein [Microthrixaceae bacterium]